jgi:hypothetical protein
MTSFDKEFYPNTCEQLKLFYALQKKLTGYDEEAHHEEINRNVLKKQCDHIEKLLHKLNVNSQEKSNYLNFLNLFKLENVSDEALSQHRQQLKKYYEILKKAVTADTALSSSEKGEFQSSLSRALRLSGVCKDQRLIADILVGLECVRNCSSPPQRFDIIGTIHVSEKEELELRKFNTFSPDPNPNGSVRRLVKKPGLHHEVDHEFSECLKDIIKALAKKRKIEFPSINPGKIGTFSYKVRNKGEIEVTVANKENNKTSAAAIRPCLNK